MVSDVTRMGAGAARRTRSSGSTERPAPRWGEVPGPRRADLRAAQGQGRGRLPCGTLAACGYDESRRYAGPGFRYSAWDGTQRGLRPRRRRAARRDDRRPALPRRPARGVAPAHAAGHAGPQRRRAHGPARHAPASSASAAARCSSTTTSAACTRRSPRSCARSSSRSARASSAGSTKRSQSGDRRRQEIVDDLAKERREQLDQLPPDLAGKVQELQQYDWMDDAARQQLRRADGAAARPAHAELLQPDVRGHAEHGPGAHAADEGHARRAQPDARAARARRGARLRGLHGALRRLLPRQPADARRAARADGAVDGADAAAA